MLSNPQRRPQSNFNFRLPLIVKRCTGVEVEKAQLNIRSLIYEEFLTNFVKLLRKELPWSPNFSKDTKLYYQPLSYFY